MAAIDKIYVTKKQLILLQKWYNLMVEEELMPETIPFNQYNLDVDNWGNKDETKPVWNLSEQADMWLLSSCPFEFVKKEIRENYNLEEEK